MPACPECGLVFDTLYNVQLHRRSGACSMQMLGAPVSAGQSPQPLMYAAGGAAVDQMAYLGGGVGAGYGYGYGKGGGGYELLGAPPMSLAAAPLPGPYMSPTEREIEQMLALQRSRQAADLAERERMMLDQQVNLVLPARQAQLQQSQQVLKDQVLQMKLQLLNNQQSQNSGNNLDMAMLRNEVAAMRGALSMQNMHGTSGSDPGPSRHKSHRLAQRAATAQTKGRDGRRQTSRHPSRRGDSDSDSDESWESLDRAFEMGDDYGGRGSRRSVSPRSDRYPRATPSQKLRHMLGSVQAELRNLRSLSSARAEPSFPTTSNLEPGLHALKLAAIEGIDMSVPLDEVDVSLKTYYMSYANNEYLLEPSLERTFPRRPPPLARHSANTVLFTVPPLEFVVHAPREMVVFVLQVSYRGRLISWATIFSRSVGPFSEGIRNSAFDLAKALQSAADFVPGANVSGFIEADPRDVLHRAESVLGQTSGSLSSPFAAKPLAPSMPGLPPLPPLPQGLPLLPGMPGCEGPFLPPTAEGNMMVLQPGKGPAAHFIMPPPTGVSILEWNVEVVKHLHRLNKTHPGKKDSKKKRGAPAPVAKANSSTRVDKKKSKAPPPPPVRRPPPPPPPVRQPSSSSSSSSTSEDDENSSDSACSSLMSPIEDRNEGSLLVRRQPAEVIDVDPSSPLGNKVPNRGQPPRQPPQQPPQQQPQQQQRTGSRAGAHFASADPPAATEPSSPEAPPRQSYTPPPAPSGPLGVVRTSPRLSNSNSTGSTPPPIPGETNSPFLQAAAPPATGMPIPAANKVPHTDAPLIERSRLRPVTDPQGNLAVPPGYKVNPSNPPCVNLDKLDPVATPSANPCVLFGLSKPTDAPPATPKPAGHGPKNNTVDVFVDGVAGVPLDAVCTRVLVYVTDELDPKTGAPINPLRHPRVFMRKPDLVAYQSVASSSFEPEFKAKMSADVGDQTHAVVIVEYITERPGPPLVFGHCCVPINKRFFAGNFVARLKAGDPRRSQERAVDEMRPADRIVDEQKRATEKYDQGQLELSVDAQALRNLMPAPPRKRAECMPLGYLIWRLESPDMNKPFFEMPQQAPLSQYEVQLFQDRKNHPTDVTPTAKGLTTEKAADEAFQGSGVTSTDIVNCMCKFNEQRGAFIKVEGMRGLGDDAAMYVVAVYMAKAPKGRQLCYTMMPDWVSDVGAPMYKDAPFIFQGLSYDANNTVTYMLLKVTQLKDAAAPPKVESIAWTMNKLFTDDAPALRQGRYVLPWLKGPLPPAAVSELLTQPIGAVYLKGMKAKSITFLEPKATLTISQGDPACAVALVDETPGRAQPRQLLVPAAVKKAFPCYTCEGMVGCTLRRAHEECFGGGDPRALLQRLNGAVQEFFEEHMKAFHEL